MAQSTPTVTSAAQFPPGLQPAAGALGMNVDPSRPAPTATEAFVDLFAISLPSCAV
jgi:hypothetical protein